jgi:hypothetical protein
MVEKHGGMVRKGERLNLLNLTDSIPFVVDRREPIDQAHFVLPVHDTYQMPRPGQDERGTAEPGRSGHVEFI